MAAMAENLKVIGTRMAWSSAFADVAVPLPICPLSGRHLTFRAQTGERPLFNTGNACSRPFACMGMQGENR